MDDTLLVKHREVKTWLDEIFGDRTIPQYELNENVINSLYQLYQHNKKMNHLSKLQFKDYQNKVEEYKIEGQRIRDVMEGVGLPIYALSNAGKTTVKTLTDLASYLNTCDVNKTSYCFMLMELEEELSQLKKEISQKEEEIKNMTKLMEESIRSIEFINSYCTSVTNQGTSDIPLAEKRKKETENLRLKTQKYKAQIEEFQKNEFIRSIDKNLHHESLIRLSEELKELKKELKPIQTKYRSYRSLPPDINLAKVKIEEAKRELVKLERELQTDIDLLNL